MSSQTTTHAAKAPAKGAAKASSGTYISLMALVMMNVTIIGSVANDVQQAYYGLSSVTLFIIGALVFFLPTGLVAAELASGWGQRGGIFRWVGEAMGPGLAFTCLLILWFQTSINFGMGVASASATIGFYTPDWDWAVQFMNHPENQFFIILAWLAYYWGLTFLSTKGVKAFARLTKYGVIIGTFIPLAFIVIFTVVWLAQGNVSNVTPTPEAFNPFADGFSLTNLALAAGVFFSFAGIDMNAAHIKQLKKPQKEFPLSIFIAMILTLIIFIAGTVCIAIVTPKSDMNLVYGLYQTYKILGATFNCPWIYVAFVWVGLGASMASLVTNMAGPSFMLGQAGRSGFLPKVLQNSNKHGMPSRLMYLQMTFMTLIAFLCFLIPNIEGFVVLITQAITILYMMYYVLMFVSFLKLRHDQPNRPRLFKVPGRQRGRVACGRPWSSGLPVRHRAGHYPAGPGSRGSGQSGDLRGGYRGHHRCHLRHLLRRVPGLQAPSLGRPEQCVRAVHLADRGFEEAPEGSVQRAVRADERGPEPHGHAHQEAVEPQRADRASRRVRAGQASSVLSGY